MERTAIWNGPPSVDAAASGSGPEVSGKHAPFIERILEPPDYGWQRDGALYVPSRRQSLSHFFRRLNVVRDRRNWLAFSSWFWSLALLPFLLVFLGEFFDWRLALLGMVYSMVLVGTHGTVWLHRFGTHRAYRFRNGLARFVVSNLVPKVVIEELYIVSHHVHHARVERPGDPYNSLGGFWYCFLADANHQPIRRGLTGPDYARLQRLLSHTGVRTNSHAQYLKWGSLAHPARVTAAFALSWSFWYGLLYLLGGHPLATAIFGCTFVWAIGVRTFNYDGHGAGKDRRREGVDFNRADLSINQTWPGYVAGEWHNNHHLFPRSARSGFLPSQPDSAWLFIRLCQKLGLVTNVIDASAPFLAYRSSSQARGRESSGAPSPGEPRPACAGVADPGAAAAPPASSH